MNWIKSLPEKIVHHFKAMLVGDHSKEMVSDIYRGKGHSLLRLHEYQHRVIVEIFRVSIAGFFAFSLILLGFAAYSLLDPATPLLMALLIALLGAVLLLALYRTLQEFRNYKGNYAELTGRLRDRLHRQGTTPGTGGRIEGESALLSSLKPKEYSGWDHKSCTHCQKNIELLANVCQHCGHEQDTLLTN